MTKVYASQTDPTANALGAHLTAAENNLLAAYSLVPGAKGGLVDRIAKDLNLERPLRRDDKGNLLDEKGDITKDPAQAALPYNEKAVQLVAEQRYQRASQMISLFSNLLDKMDSMKQRLIQKFGQG